MDKNVARRAQNLMRLVWTDIYLATYSVVIAVAIALATLISYMRDTWGAAFLAPQYIYAPLVYAGLWSVRKTLQHQYIAKPTLKSGVFVFVLTLIVMLANIGAGVFALVMSNAASINAFTFVIYVALVFVLALLAGGYAIATLMYDIPDAMEAEVKEN